MPKPQTWLRGSNCRRTQSRSLSSEGALQGRWASPASKPSARRNFKLLAHHVLDGFGGMGEGMSVQIAPDGRRIIWLAHESAPKNFTAVDVSDPRKPKVVLPDRSAAATCARTRWRPAATSWRSPTRPRRTGRSPPASSCSTSRCRRSRSRSRSSTARAAFARRAPALVLRRRIRPHGVGRGGLRADASARRPVLPLHRRAQSVEAGRSRPLVDAGHAQGDNVSRRRRAIRSTRATARTTPTSIRSARTAATSPTSTAACTCSTFPTRRTRRRSRRWTNSPPYTGFMHTVVPLFDRGLMLVTDESTENNAKDWPKLVWMLDARDETNLVPIATCPLPDHTRLRRRAAASARTTSTRTCRCRPAGSPTRSCSARSSTAACAPTTFPIRISRRIRRSSCRAPRPGNQDGSPRKSDVKARAAKTAKPPSRSRRQAATGQPRADGTVTWNFKLLSPPPARRLRRHGRRHVDPDRAGRPPHPLAGA